MRGGLRATRFSQAVRPIPTAIFLLFARLSRARTLDCGRDHLGTPAHVGSHASPKFRLQTGARHASVCREAKQRTLLRHAPTMPIAVRLMGEAHASVRLTRGVLRRPATTADISADSRMQQPPSLCSGFYVF
jgi:hypothetical protein